MPDMQSSTPNTNNIPTVLEVPSAFEDCDFALGCECADPTLQIERWTLEARGAEAG